MATVDSKLSISQFEVMGSVKPHIWLEEDGCAAVALIELIEALLFCIMP